ncbi:hypothetical protein [Oceanibium sediminis]|uniref:hypothetical protein n=1 Tax=Oceanibium sediminis TaxID=2026339 RepID=UPI000DD3C9DA|nr:hypothetical protein [Oceanibium sediminis]
MRRALPLTIALALAAPAAADSLPQIGERIPVFGPSEERAEFFAKQEADRQEAYATLQAERAEAARQARAEDAARKPGYDPFQYRPRPGALTRKLVCTYPTPAPRPRPVTPANGSKAPRMYVRPAPQDPICRVIYTRVPDYPPVYVPYPYSDTEVTIGIGNGGVTGRLTHRRPGLTVDITKD